MKKLFKRVRGRSSQKEPKNKDFHSPAIDLHNWFIIEFTTSTICFISIDNFGR